MSNHTIEVQERNPFQNVNIPFILKAYCLRKSHSRNYPPVLNALRNLVPGGAFFRRILNVFSRFQKGTFDVIAKNQNRTVRFNISNTQFHSVYFPEYRHSYEKESLALLDTYLTFKPKSIFYDLGSNWGHFSLFVATNDLFCGEVHAFEPDPESFQDLQSAVSQSQLQAAIRCQSLAMAEKPGAAYIRRLSALNSGTAYVDDVKGNAITKTTLDLYTTEHTPPDFIKIDAEGSELPILQGASSLLEKAAPMILLENWCHASNVEEAIAPLKLLSEKGYRLFEPAFLYSSAGTDYLLGYEGGRYLNRNQNELHLIGFEYRSRPLLRTQLNIFACHKSKTAFLEQYFKQY